MSEQAQEHKLRVFKTTMSSNKFIFKSGKTAGFVNGRYMTSNPQEIKELEEEILEHQNPYFYIDKNEKEITSEQAADPMAALRAKIIADYLATQQGKEPVVPQKDFGSTQTAPVIPVSSKGVASIAAGGKAVLTPGPTK